MELVYRLEDSTTFLGPYHSSIPISWATKNHNNGARCPNFKKDIILQKFNFSINDIKKYKFAFESIKQLKKWFSKKEIRNLTRHGQNITVYTCKKIIKGDKQVLFIPNKKICEIPANIILEKDV